MKASLERRLRKIEEALAKRKVLRLPQFFFIPIDCDDIAAFEARCRAETRKNRVPQFIEFIGPEGGSELGTGPTEPEEDEGLHNDKSV